MQVPIKTKMLKGYLNNARVDYFVVTDSQTLEVQMKWAQDLNSND